MIKGARKIKLSVTAHGMVPSAQGADPLSYQWVDSRGRPCSPPPGRHLMGSTTPSGEIDPRVYQEPNVRKVNLFLHTGEGYGISIRGGVEHGLGIYVSLVEDGSIGAINGVKVGKHYHILIIFCSSSECV